MIPILSTEQKEEYYDLDNPQFNLTEQFESNKFASGSKYTYHYLWHLETGSEGISIGWEDDFFEDENSYKENDGEFVIYYRIIRK